MDGKVTYPDCELCGLDGINKIILIDRHMKAFVVGFKLHDGRKLVSLLF